MEKRKRDEQTHIVLNTRNCMEYLLFKEYIKHRSRRKDHTFHKWLADNNLITKEELERLNKIK